METQKLRVPSGVLAVGPHSLGKLIEWKPPRIFRSRSHRPRGCPHSLGKLIEWKLRRFYFRNVDSIRSPLAGETN